MKQNDVQIEIEKEKEEKKRSKKTARKGNTQICRLANRARGDVAPRQKNRIRHQGEQGSEKKSDKAIQEVNGKRHNEKEGENGEWEKGKGKTKKKRNKRKRERNMREVGIEANRKARVSGGTMLTTW